MTHMYVVVDHMHVMGDMHNAMLMWAPVPPTKVSGWAGILQVCHVSAASSCLAAAVTTAESLLNPWKKFLQACLVVQRQAETAVVATKKEC